MMQNSDKSNLEQEVTVRQEDFMGATELDLQIYTAQEMGWPVENFSAKQCKTINTSSLLGMICIEMKTFST